jgi:hypothetical protein
MCFAGFGAVDVSVAHAGTTKRDVSVTGLVMNPMVTDVIAFAAASPLFSTREVVVISTVAV